MLRDQIVFTVKSQKLREKLINEGSDLTLEKAIDIARTYELSKQQLRSMNEEDTSIHALKKKPSAHTSTRREEYVPRKFQLDTGAKCNFISTKTFSILNLDVIKTKPDISLKSYSGHSIKPRYAVNIPCTYKGETCDVKFYIVDIDSTSVLGGKACADFELIKRLYTIQTDDNQIIESNQTNPIPEDIRKNYADIFKGIGCIPGEHSIQIDSTVQPVVHAPRKIPIGTPENGTK
ncbi:Hypothetical predicted protein [Mytilus galloprovincialis]|uniref:Uncharacterized protein n=1 Tax=Mytilus galloprovincialis TaxID=29158 RepID=A0A8B6EI31_MYTGA|nr:Hypothetical predicted protein [Mytilus galloprovincialis]